MLDVFTADGNVKGGLPSILDSVKSSGEPVMSVLREWGLDEESVGASISLHDPSVRRCHDVQSSVTLVVESAG